MSVDHQGTVASPSVDSGLACLVMLARFDNVAVSPQQLAHEFAEDGRSFEHHDLLLAAKKLGLKAKAARIKAQRLAHASPPATAADNDNLFFIIARIDDGKALIYDPQNQRPEILAFANIEVCRSSELIFIRAEVSLTGELSKLAFMLDLQHESERRVAVLTQELKKVEQRNRLMALTAPVDGTVQQLAIHIQGGVVTEAQPLMVIVPSDKPVKVEEMLENKDIGFVRSGQEVEIKVETFTFTKYGVVHGTVTSISNDAIEDEKQGLVYGARIQLQENHIRVNDQKIALSPCRPVALSPCRRGWRAGRR